MVLLLLKLKCREKGPGVTWKIKADFIALNGRQEIAQWLGLWKGQLPSVKPGTTMVISRKDKKGEESVRLWEDLVSTQTRDAWSSASAKWRDPLTAELWCLNSGVRWASLMQDISWDASSHMMVPRFGLGSTFIASCLLMQEVRRQMAAQVPASLPPLWKTQRGVPCSWF